MTAPSLQERVGAVLVQAGLGAARVCVAFSGGLDSCVLLDLLVRLAREQPLRLSAVHVDHGLSPHAAKWAAFCRERCRDYGIDLQVSAVTLAGGAGVEAAARAARYAVFAQLPVDAVALAHTLDDQAETVLLRLNRGSGVHGLAGMPVSRRLAQGICVVRPLLAVPRAEVAAHAACAGLDWVEDESNAGTRFDRNYVRHEVLPAVSRRFPAYRHTWTRAALNMADAAQVLDEVAATDAAMATTGAVAPDPMHDGRLALAALRACSPARARNLLRWFVVRQGGPLPGRNRLDEALRQFLDAGAASQPCVAFGGVRLRRHGDTLHAMAAQAPAPGWSLPWEGQEVLVLGEDLGVLHWVNASGQGISRRRLLGAQVRVTLRAGGERIRLAPGRPTRTLKNLLREAGIPAWQRERLPILRVDDAVAWVAGVGWDCRFAAARDEAGVIPVWAPRAQAAHAAQCG